MTIHNYGRLRKQIGDMAVPANGLMDAPARMRGDTAQAMSRPPTLPAVRHSISPQ